MSALALQQPAGGGAPVDQAVGGPAGPPRAPARPGAVEHAVGRSHRHGGAPVLVGRLGPGARGAVPPTAGTARRVPVRCSAPAGAGSLPGDGLPGDGLPGDGLPGGGGRALGSPLERVGEHARPVDRAVVAVVVLLVRVLRGRVHRARRLGDVREAL